MKRRKAILSADQKKDVTSITVYSTLARDNYIMVRVSLSVAVCKNTEQQTRVTRDIRRWVETDIFWESAEKEIEEAAKRLRTGVAPIVIGGEYN